MECNTLTEQARHWASTQPDKIWMQDLHETGANEYTWRETVAEIAVLVKWLKKKYSSKYKIWLKGYSSAGTTAIAAAASDDNIDGIAVGGCVGLANETILKRGTTGYNDIPSLLKWFDQDVMISLISPRPCIIVAGTSDHIWPYKFAEKALKVPKIIYNSDKSDNNLVLLKLFTILLTFFFSIFC